MSPDVPNPMTWCGHCFGVLTSERPIRNARMCDCPPPTRWERIGDRVWRLPYDSRAWAASKLRRIASWLDEENRDGD